MLEYLNKTKSSIYYTRKYLIAFENNENLHFSKVLKAMD